MNFINGHWQNEAGEFFESKNPANGKILWQGVESRYREVDLAVKAAKRALYEWRNLAWQERLIFLQKFIQFLERDREEVAQLISDETGKPLWEAKTEVNAALGKLQHSERAFIERCSERKVPIGEAESITRFRCVGVMAILGPFNFPLHLPNGQIIPALLAGNTIVFKPSEETPAVGHKMVRLWDETGLPDGVINLVQGSKKTGEDLINHDYINGVLFTGSYQAAWHIHHDLAGKFEKLLVLEAGGNNPLIADGSGDLENVCLIIAQSAFLTSGQRCVCARRLIIPSGEKGDKLIEKLVQFCGRINWSLPSSNPEPFMGTLISVAAAERVIDSYNKLIEAGAQILKPLIQDSKVKNLLSPAIVDVTDIADRQDEEIFGPLLQVIRPADMESCFVEAESTRYGLSAGILSEDAEIYEEFRRFSSAGIINWNRQITGAVGGAPFGGAGLSGNFRPGAYFAADFCSYPVASIEAPTLGKDPLFPPGISQEVQ